MKILKIYRSDTDKQGNPLKTKDGRPYTRIAFQTEEYGSKWVSGFMGYWNQNWEVGDDVDVEIEEKGEYLNFRKPDPIKALEKRVSALEVAMLGEKDEDAPDDIDDVSADVAGDEIRDDDVPF